MGINEQNQGDYQKLDPRSAEQVRAVEEEQFLNGLLGINRIRISELFANRESPENLANDIRVRLDATARGIDTEIGEQIETDLTTNLREVQRQERMAPQVSVTERLQRQTREFASAVRRAIPADISSRNRTRYAVGETWEVAAPIGPATNVQIDLAHDFWQNRIQNETELVATLTGLPHNSPWLIDTATGQPVAGAGTISAAEAQAIAASTEGVNPTEFHERLLESRLRTLFSDQQVSSFNVETAIRLAKQNDNVRRSVVPPSPQQAQQQLTGLRQEQTIARVLDSMNSINIPTTTLPNTANWQEVQNSERQIRDDIDDVGALVPGDRHTLRAASGGGVVRLSTNGNVAKTQQSNALDQLGSKLRELRELNAAYAQYASSLSSIIEAVRNTSARKGTPLPDIANMFTPGATTPIAAQFNQARTPQSIINDTQNVLQLQSSASEYDSLIQDQQKVVEDANEGKNTLTGRDAVLKVYDEYYRRVRGLDSRRAEEARQALYARNEQGREEGEARGEAVDELMGRQQGESVLNISNSAHEFTHGRAEDIVCKLAETNEINAPTQGTRSLIRLGARRNGAAPKWSALPYPRLMTAYAALKKLSEDSSSPIALRRTGYLRRQMDEITTLLADKYTEQVELDYGRITESDAEATERRAQGERNRKQRLLRLLIHNPLPSTYEERATNAIEATASKVRRVRRGIASAGRATGRFVVNRTKNVVLGEGSNANPLTYPAKGIKGFARWAVTPLG